MNETPKPNGNTRRRSGLTAEMATLEIGEEMFAPTEKAKSLHMIAKRLGMKVKTRQIPAEGAFCEQIKITRIA